MELDWTVLIRPYPGAPRGGDLGVVIPLEDGALAVLVDASGHGLAAYAVAQTARNTILESGSRDPAALLTELDAALSGGIGAAVSVARVFADRLEFAGIGNVNASVGLKPLVVRPGVVGVRMRTPRVMSTDFPPDTWLLMHTDGVSRPRSIPGGSAESVATALMDDRGSDFDDSGILLLRWRAVP